MAPKSRFASNSQTWSEVDHHLHQVCWSFFLFFFGDWVHDLHMANACIKFWFRTQLRMKPRIEGEIRNQTQDHFRESYNSNPVLATALITWLSSGTSCICNTLSEGMGEWVCSSQICVFTWRSSLWNSFGRLENVPPVPYYTLSSSKLEKLGLKFKPVETMFDDCIAWFRNKHMLWYDNDELISKKHCH